VSVEDEMDAYDSGTPFDGEPERWAVTDDGQAAWAMRKIRAARDRMADIDAVAAREVERITEWAEKAKSGPQRDEDFFTGLLQAYAMRERLAGRKTVSTPYGRVSSREGRARVTVTDPDAAVPWLVAHGMDSCVRTTTSVNVAGVKASELLIADGGAVVDVETGEAVPGLASEEPGLSITVTTA